MKNFHFNNKKSHKQPQTRSVAQTSQSNPSTAWNTKQMKYYRDHGNDVPLVKSYFKPENIPTLCVGFCILNLVGIVSSGALPTSNNPPMPGTGSTGLSYVAGSNITNSTDLAYAINTNSVNSG